MIEFWRGCHSRKEIEWLTGTSLASYLRLYELGPRLAELDVTEIGVGFGYATRDLAKDNRVTAVDVAPEALEGLPCNTLLVEDLHRAPPADLAICHLVMQHCEAEAVAHLLTVPLKPGGEFAFQFAWNETEKSSAVRAMVRDQRLHWHTRAEMAPLLKAARLRVIWERQDVYTWQGDRIRWSLMKAIRV